MKGKFAVVGMGGVFPNAFNLKHYWETLLQGDSTAQKMPTDHRWDYQRFFSDDKSALDRTYSSLGGFIENFKFDPKAVNCTVQESEALAPMEKWLLTALRECLTDLPNDTSSRAKLILGGTGVSDPVNDLLLEAELLEDFRKLGADVNEIQPHLRKSVGATGFTRGLSEYMLHQSAALAIRKLLPAPTDYMIVDAACASSLYSIEFGIRGLQDRQIDIAYCGGVFSTEPLGSVLFSKLNGLSKNGCFPFDERADGTLFGDGAGVIAIKRLEDAIRDNNTIYGVIRGIGMSSDGKGKAVYAPNANGQVLAIHRAYEEAGVPLDSIQYVEAHATGTPLGDLTEYSSLSSVFNQAGISAGAIRLGSVKGNFGHLGWAAGVASVIKVLLCLKHSKIPPQANFKTLSKTLQDVPSPFRVNTHVTEWLSDANHPPRRAAVSGFGFGGTNAHLILEEFRLADPLAELPPDLDTPVSPEIVIVNVGCVFPEAVGLDEVQQKVLSGLESTDSVFRFSSHYKVSPIKYKMIPRMANVTDTSQFLLLDATDQVVKGLNPYWNNYHAKTDVIISYVGALNKYLTHGKRICWNAIQAGLPSPIENWETQIRDQIPPPTEDSFPGVMPSLLSGRVSNFFNFQGTNLCINAGLHSFTSAMELGIQSLVHGRAEVVLVGAVQVAGSFAHDLLWKEWTGEKQALSEGAMVFALMKKSDAETRGIPILGQVEIANESKPGASSVPLSRNSRPFGNLGLAASAADLVEALAASKNNSKPSACYIASSKNEISRRGISVRTHSLPPLVGNLIDPELPNEISDSSLPEKKENLRFVPHLELRPLTANSDPFHPPSFPIPPHALLITNTTALAQAWLKRHPGWTVILATQLAGELPSDLLSKNVIVLNLDQQDQLQKEVSALKAPAEIYFNFDFQPYADNLFHPEIEKLWWVQYHFIRQHFEALNATQAKITLLFLNTWISRGVLHPYSGLFSGFTKALQTELPQTRIKLIFSSPVTIDETETQLRHEARENDTVVYYQGSERSIQVLSSIESSPSGLSLNSNSVILAFGGGKGITRAAVEALLEKYRCKIIIVGSTQLGDTLSPTVESDPHPSLGDFIKLAKVQHPDKSIKVIKKEYARVQSARAIRKTLEKDRNLGYDVSYLSCDVNDAQQVSDLVSRVAQQFGSIDLVLYGAGVSGPLGKINTYDYKESIPVTAVKVSAMTRIASAVTSLKPRYFVSFSSIASQGIEGQASYGGASDFQNSFSSFMNATHPSCMYLCVNWPGWQDVGMLADNSALVEEIKKNKLFSLITPEMGKKLFLQELQAIGRTPSVYLFGGVSDLDYYRQRGKFGVGLTEPTTVAVPPSESTQPFYVDRVLEKNSDRILVERVLDLERDSYLKSHRVQGDPVLPGMFELEMAAETALLFAESSGEQGALQVAEFKESRFHRFVKVFPHKKVSLRIEGRTTENLNEIHIRIFSDFIAPNGKVLEKDRLHFETTVRLLNQQKLPNESRRSLSQSVRDFPTAPGRAVLDPYHELNSPVYLDGIFVTVPHRTHSEEESRGVYQPSLPELKATQGLNRFRIPSLLLDGALRLATGKTEHEFYIPLMVPIRIQSIRFFEDLNDILILEKYRYLQVIYNHSKNVCEITTPAGNLFCDAKGFNAHTLGFIDERDRSYCSSADVAKLPVLSSLTPLAVSHEAVTSELPHLGYYLGKVLEKTDSQIVAERHINLTDDFYFRTAAKLNGIPVLPGSFQMEIAVEAALCLRPDLIPQCVENMEFVQAFKMFEDRPNVIRVQATLGSRPTASPTANPDSEPCTVDVSLFSDLIHKGSGKVLRENILHSTLRVVLGTSPAPQKPALRWDAKNSRPEKDIPGILYLAQSPLHLGEYFTSVGASQVTNQMIRSVYKNTASIKREIFGRHRIAPLLLDALLQNSLSRQGDLISSGIPKRINKIHLCSLTNDWQIANEFDSLVLLTQKSPESSFGTVLQAITPEGQVLYQAEGFESYPLGYIDTRTQTWTPETSVQSQSNDKRPNSGPLPISGPRRMLRKLRLAPLSQAASTSLQDDKFSSENLIVFSLGSIEQPPMKELEQLFYRVQQLKDAGPAQLNVICTQAWADPADLVLQPFSGAVEGLLKSVRAECPQLNLRLIFTDKVDFSENLRLLNGELAEGSTHWISYHLGEKRFLSGLAEAAEIQKRIPVASPKKRVILVTGGGRGITAAACQELAKTGQYTFVILGRTDLDSDSPSNIPFGLDKSAWIQAMKKNRPESSLAEILVNYQALQSRMELQKNLEALRARGSEVVYFTCDLADSIQVATVLKQVHERFTDVDHVIHGSGTDHSASLEKKTFSEFQSIFRVKVAGFLNLLKNLDMSRLQSWMSFGSIHGVFGTSGQVDYCAANECLNSLTQFYQARYPLLDWCVLNWPIWSGLGMASHNPELINQFRKQGRFLLSSNEGVALFLNEFSSAHAKNTQIVFLDKLDARYFRTELPLLDQIIQKDETRAVAIKTFSTERDSYLKHHLANGDPSLSAAFEMEMALELIDVQYPQLKVAEIQKCSLVRFVKVFHGQPKTVKVVLNTLEALGNEKLVEVQLFSDFIHASGRALRRDLLHWSARFRLMPELGKSVSNEPFAKSSLEISRDIPVPVYQDDAHVYYDPSLRSIRRRFLNGKSEVCSEVQLLSAHDSFLSRFCLPHEIMDALLLSIYFEKKEKVVLAMPFVTESMRIFSDLHLALQQEGSSFRVVSQPTEEVPNRDFDISYGPSILKCPSIQIFSETGRLCVEAKGIYLMIYDTLERES
jgi:3-oxoacyl-(acyl-carrier-protein) synthase/NAD(P)-dependent dehydrogenase (short-subunit alcohol dehydrogenase family)